MTRLVPQVAGSATVASWQVMLTVFFVLLPVALMVDFWGDERLDARGRPVLRPWVRQSRHPTRTAGSDRDAARRAVPGRRGGPRAGGSHQPPSAGRH